MQVSIICIPEVLMFGVSSRVNGLQNFRKGYRILVICYPLCLEKFITWWQLELESARWPWVMNIWIISFKH